MQFVYLVMACYDYEGSSPVRAFVTRGEAEAFAVACATHNTTAPECPDQSASDAIWDAYFSANDHYRKTHPAGDSDYSADNYVVRELQVGLPRTDPAVVADAGGTTG